MNERAIFFEALEQTDPARRDAFLEQSCSGDPGLRQRVQGLLDVYDDAGSFLEHPPLKVAATEPDGKGVRSQLCEAPAGPFRQLVSDSLSDATCIGAGLEGEMSLDFLGPPAQAGHLGTLGPYEISGVIGRGGMGLVLQGHDPRLNRVVAIKVLAPELASNSAARKRFLREARAAAAVSHDHVVTIHAIDEVAGMPYIVMEYVAGLSLQQRIDRTGPLELKEILRIGRQIAAGLSAAHEQGLVHRDIKPANILLENGVERVKITDFGLARAVDDVGMTQTGVVAGTPQYMSPEQAEGQHVDHRSDLFSLGSVLYALCTGRPPFRAETTIAVIRRVCDDAPRPIWQVNPELPEWLIAVIDRLLEKRPEHRIQSAAEVTELLGQYLAHVQNPELAPPPEMAMPSSAARPDKLDGRGVPGRRSPVGAVPRAARRAPGAPAWMWLSGMLLAAATLMIALIDMYVVDLPNRTVGPPMVALFTAWLFAVMGGLYLRHVRTQVDATGNRPSGPDGSDCAEASSTYDSHAGSLTSILSRMTQSRSWMAAAVVVLVVGLLAAVVQLGHLRQTVQWLAGKTGQITLEVDGPEVDVRHNDQKIAVTDSGRATLFLVPGDYDIVSMAHGEMISTTWHDIGRNVHHSIRISDRADAVVVRGPLSGREKAERFLKAAVEPQHRPEAGDADHAAPPSTNPATYRPQPGDPITFPAGEVSFADRVVRFDLGETNVDYARDPQAALGPPEGEWTRDTSTWVALGHGGVLVLEFTDNVLIDGSGPDLALFEVGGAPIDPFDVAISTDGENWIDLGRITGPPFTVDIGPKTRPGEQFRFVKLTDSNARYCCTPGADFDAVGAINTLPRNRQSGEASAVGPGAITELHRFDGHQDNIDSIGFSPDGRFLFVGCAEKLLYQWDVASGEVVRKIPVGDYPRSLAGHPDGQHVLTGHYGGGITMWSLATGRALRQFPGHTGSVQALHVLPGGKRMLSAGYDGLARLWNVETGTPIHSFSEPYCAAAAITDDGRLAAHGSTGGGFRLWKTDSGQTLHEIDRQGDVINAMAFSPGGEYLVTGDGRGLIEVWDVKSGRKVHHFDAHDDKVTSLVFTPDGRHFLSGGVDKTLRVFDLSRGLEVEKLESETLCVSYLAISPDGRTLASGGGMNPRQIDGVWQPRKDGDYAARLWRLPERFWPDRQRQQQQLVALHRLEGHTGFIDGVAYSPNGGIVVTGGDDGTVRAWDAGNGSELWNVQGMGSVNAVAVSPDGRHIAAGTVGEHQITLLELETGRVIRGMGPNNRKTCSLAFSPDGELLLSGDYPGATTVWDVTTGELLRSLTGEGPTVETVAFSRDGRIAMAAYFDNSIRLDGRIAVAADFDNSIRLWDAHDWKLLREIHQASREAALSSDGRLLICGGGDLYDTQSGERLRKLDIPDNVSELHFTPDDRHIVVCQWSNLLRVIDVATGNEVGRAETSTHAINEAAVSPDGRFVATGGGWTWKDRVIRSGDNVARLCRLPESVWPVGHLTEIRRFEGHAKRPTGLVYSSDGMHALSCSGDATVRLWDVGSGETVQVLTETGLSAISSLALSQDEETFVTGHHLDGVLRVWDPDTGQIVRRINAHDERDTVVCVQFVPGTNRLVSATSDGVIKLWNAETGQLLGESVPFRGLGSLVALADDRIIVGMSNLLQMSEVPAREAVRSLQLRESDAVTDIAVSPDSELVASATSKGTIYLWDLTQNSETGRLDGHTDKVEAIAFTPDGRHLISGSWDRTLRVWDVAARREIARATTTNRVSLELGISPDGRTVLAGGGEWWNNESREWVAENDYDLRLWRLPESLWAKSVESTGDATVE